MQLLLKIDPSKAGSLQRQLADGLRRMIRDGTLLPGTKIPSTRALSEQLKLSRNTVVLAYDKLIAEGYLESRTAQATYVCTFLPQGYLTVPPFHQPLGLDQLNALDRTDVCNMELNLVTSSSARLPLDFRIGRPDGSLFPTAIWRRLLLESLGGIQHALFEYADPAGHLPLRTAIGAYLRLARGIKVDPEQIIIVAGCQQGLGLTGLLLDISNKDVILENPCYRGAEFAFRYLGANLIHVPVDEGGLNTEFLPQQGARLVYVTPSHQFPLGYTMSVTRREKFLAWAEETSTYILEDDYDNDFRYSSSPIAALQAMDRAQRVIYLGTFSKSIGPNLRLGYLIVPKHLVKPAHATKAIMDNGHPWLEQVVVGEFISSSAFENHLVRIRKHYLRRRDLVIAKLQEVFGPSKFDGIDGGMHLAWSLPDHLPGAYDLQQRAKSAGVGIYSLRESPAYLAMPFSGDDRIVLLGYAGLTEENIIEAIEKLARITGPLSHGAT